MLKESDAIHPAIHATLTYPRYPRGMEQLFDALLTLDTIRAVLACTAASAMLFFVAFKIKFMRRAAWGDAISVILKVVAVRGDNQNAYGSVEYRAEYEILEGPHAGTRRLSEVTSHPAVHKAGETATGLYNPVSGELESLPTLKRVAIIENVLIGAGLLIIAFGVFYTAM